MIDIKPTHTIQVDLGINEGGVIQQELTNLVYKYMYRYVPFSGNTGRVHLRENVIITPDSITFNSPYASRQYYGSQTGKEWHYTTPGTGPYWDERMLTAHKQDIINEISKKYGGK
jgi:hypothetical protein